MPGDGSGGVVDADRVAARVAALRVFAGDGAAPWLRPIVVTARLAFDAAACSIALIDSASNELVYMVADGEGSDAIIGARLALGRGLGGFAASSGQVVSVEDVRADPRFAIDVAERTGYVPNAMLVAPISDGDDVLGVLSILDRSNTQHAGMAALDLAAGFARSAASVLCAAEFGGRFAIEREHESSAAAFIEFTKSLEMLTKLGDAERATAAALLREFVAFARRRAPR